MSDIPKDIQILIQPIATIITAVIAVLVSFVTLGISLTAGRRAAKRGAFRDLIAEHFGDASSALHEVVATADVLLKTRSAKSRASWIMRGNKAKEDLMSVRKQLRITLGPMDAGSRNLARLPSWTAHSERYPKHSSALLLAGDQLREVLDDVLLAVYFQGEPPTWWQSWRVSKANTKLLKAYAAFRDRK